MGRKIILLPPFEQVLQCGQKLILLPSNSQIIEYAEKYYSPYEHLSDTIRAEDDSSLSKYQNQVNFIMNSTDKQEIKYIIIAKSSHWPPLLDNHSLVFMSTLLIYDWKLTNSK